MKAEVLALAELDDDIDCRSLATLVTPGQAADTRQLIPLLELVRVPRPNGIGRPRSRPESVTGDQAYSSRSHRQARRGKRIRTTIPEPNDQIADRQRRGSRGGRPPAFDPAAYRHRNQVDRGFNLGVDYQATLDLVEMLDRLRAVPGRHDPRERT